MLNNNFSYKHCFCSSKRFLLHLCWYWHFFSFSSAERFQYVLSLFWPFVFFFLQKDFYIFHMLLFEAFLCAYYNSYLSFLYMKIFFIRIFSIRIRRNFYVISNILQHFFFLQQDIYILLQALENNSFYLF